MSCRCSGALERTWTLDGSNDVCRISESSSFGSVKPELTLPSLCGAALRCVCLCCRCWQSVGLRGEHLGDKLLRPTHSRWEEQGGLHLEHRGEKSWHPCVKFLFSVWHCWHSHVVTLQPCYLKDWEMHVQFKVHGSGKKNLNGDGIAIWYTRDRLHPGTVSLTLRNSLFTFHFPAFVASRFGFTENAPDRTCL